MKNNWFKEGDIIYIGSGADYLTRIKFLDMEVLNVIITGYEGGYGKGNVHYTNDEKLFFRNLDQENKKKYCKPWEEVTEKYHWEMLGCLPPQMYKRIQGGNIFRMCEYQTGNITDHFMELDGKFYKGTFDTGEYKDILDITDLNYGTNGKTIGEVNGK